MMVLPSLCSAYMVFIAYAKHSEKLSKCRISFYNIIAYAMSGIMASTGEPGRPPVIMSVPVADLAAEIDLDEGLGPVVGQHFPHASRTDQPKTFFGIICKRRHQAPASPTRVRDQRSEGEKLDA